jgi:4-amino-4-deoxy-L-arabinose transferase-like glycosyltransferase
MTVPRFVHSFEFWGFVLVLVLAALLRFPGLGATPITEDEAYHAVVAESWAETGSPLPPSGIPYIRGFPLVVLELACLQLLPGHFEFALRLPTALLGVLNVLLVGLLARRTAPTRVALLVAGLYAVASWTTSMAALARMYELFTTTTLLTLLAFERLVERPTWIRAGWLGLAHAAALAAHDLGVFLVLLPVAGMVVHARQTGLLIKLILMPVVVLVFRALYAPLLYSILAGGVITDPGGATANAAVIIPELDLQREVVAAGASAWALCAVVVMALVGVVLRRAEPEDALGVLPWMIGVVVPGLAGFAMVSVLVTAAYFAYTVGSMGPVDRMLDRRRAVAIALAAIGAMWGVVALAVSASDGTPSPLGIAHLLADALRYPQVQRAVIRPLAVNPDSTVWMHLFLGLTAILAVGAVVRGSRILDRRSLAVRLLFLVAALGAIGVANSHYRSSRYAYFLFPVALVSAGEALAILTRYGPRWAGRVLLGLVLVLGLGVELPASVRALPGSSGHRDHRGPVSWLPDYGTRARLPGVRERQDYDYRAAAEFLIPRRGPSDLVLADASHQMLVYLSPIDGHLSPPLHEYAEGTTHYFSGATYLRTDAELRGFLKDRMAQGADTAWVAITGYPSRWTKRIPMLLDEREVWRQDPIVLYGVPADTLWSLLGEIPDTTSTFELDAKGTLDEL